MREQAPQAMLMAIHLRLLAYENSAREALVDVLLEPLVEELSGRFRRADEHLIRDGVIDALLKECANPERYDAARGVPLDRFLAMAAQQKVHKLLLSERQLKQRERMASRRKKEADVALDPAAAYILQEAKESQEQKIQNLLALVINPKDREILLLQVQAVRDTASYARILEIENLPLERQRREVKRHKDRLKRLATRHGFGSAFSS